MLERVFTRIAARAAVAAMRVPGRSFSQLAIRYSAFGVPSKVLKLDTIEDPRNDKLESSEVLLKFLAAPINPSDINMAEGVYGIRPALPAVAGNEGVALVEKVGPNVKGLKVGDWVLPSKPAFGTWRQFAKAAEDNLIRISNDIPMEYAATLSVNPCTAYRILTDFEDLKAGDYIVQNGANSMVGLAVVQLARERGIKTINIVRGDRPNAAETLRLLTNLGGDINILDTYLQSSGFQEILKELPPIKLALNCVGGESVGDLARIVAPKASIVTFGGMSKRHSKIPLDVIAYKQLKLHGFWVSRWHDTHSKEERSAMFESIIDKIRQKKLVFFYQTHDLDDFSYAFDKSEEPFAFRKVVLNLNFPDRMQEHDARPASDYDIFDAN